jgi:hypothetical protein
MEERDIAVVLIYAAKILADECHHKRFWRKLRFRFMHKISGGSLCSEVIWNLQRKSRGARD